MSNEILDKLKQAVDRVIRNIINYKIIEGLRVSIDGKFSPNNLQLIYNNVPSNHESIEDWCKTIFHQKKFAIIQNGCQHLDLELKKNIAILFAPLIENFGIPPQGLEVTLFFGNYGYTPLGFHRDPEGNKVTHLHLGPGRKDIYTIPPSIIYKPTPLNR